MLTTLHPERVKAEIRMRCGTLKRFAEQNEMPEERVRDYLRGRSKTAHAAVAKLLDINPDHLTLSRKVSIRGPFNANVDAVHPESESVE